MRLSFCRYRLRAFLVSYVVVGCVVSGGMLFYCGVAAPVPQGLRQAPFLDSMRLVTSLIGAVWAIAPVVCLFIRRQTFEADSSEHLPAIGMVMGVVLLFGAIIDTPGMEWPWRDYPWILPAFAFAVVSNGFLVLLDRRTLKPNSPTMRSHLPAD